MSPVDWSIVIGMLVLMGSGVALSRVHMRSVADFLAAGRTAGRYVLTVAQGLAGLGAITIVANFEMNYQAGFAMTWWGFSTGVVVLIITISGWVVYRFRETRAMTMAQFFEMRYSRNFRVFTGLIAFLSGIINFGIFPAVGARFFIYFCGLPQRFGILGVEASTFAFTMVCLLAISLAFVFIGGQIAVIITDFIQGVFVNVVFLFIIIYFLNIFDFQKIYEALQTAPVNASLINPFKTSAAKDFNFWFFLIGIFGVIYSTLSWQGTQGYNSAAKSAHEAKMAAVLTNWRGIPQNLLLLFIPICAYTVMHHHAFSAQMAAVSSSLQSIDGSAAVRSQLTVPLVLTHFLPPGFMGAFAAVMLAAFVTTHDTYLHSWGSIFVQDVLLPLRRRPFSPPQHIRILRLSIVGVAVFIFFFSLLFQQSQYIMLFFAITGAIFAGGSGAVIIGGLYWKRGTTAAAWAAMITGSSVAVGGILIHQVQPGFFINGQVFWFIAMVGSIAVYVGVSLAGRKPPFDMDRLLWRGRYRDAGEYSWPTPVPRRVLRLLGMGQEFTRGDRLICTATYVWVLGWAAVFIAGTVLALTHGVSDAAWMKFWYVYLIINIVAAVGIIVWFTFGGVRDLRTMIGALRHLRRDEADDGRVRAEKSS